METTPIVGSDPEIDGRTGVFTAMMFVHSSGDHTVLGCRVRGEAAFPACSGPTFLLGTDPIAALEQIDAEVRHYSDLQTQDWMTVSPVHVELEGPFVSGEFLMASESRFLRTDSAATEVAIFQGVGALESGGDRAHRNSPVVLTGIPHL